MEEKTFLEKHYQEIIFFGSLVLVYTLGRLTGYNNCLYSLKSAFKEAAKTLKVTTF